MKDAAAREALFTRRAIAVLHITFTPRGRGTGFREHDYAQLRYELNRFEVVTKAKDFVVYAIDSRRRFLVAREKDGPSLLFEEHLLTDPFFCGVAGRLLRRAIAVAGRRGGTATITLTAKAGVRDLWTGEVPLDAKDLAKFAFDVSMTGPPVAERRLSRADLLSRVKTWNEDVSLGGAAELGAIVRTRASHAQVRTYAPGRSKGTYAFSSHGRMKKFSLGRLKGTHAFPSQRQVKPYAPFRSKRSPRMISEAARGSSGEPETISVFYATDRLPTGDKHPGDYYGYEPDKNLHLGVVTVSMPPDRPIGKVAKPSIWKLQFRPNPMKHMILTGVTELRASDYYRQMSAAMAINGGRRAFVFVHGFNVTFEDAALRTAQMHHDLKFEGVPIFYSWPSKGSAAPRAYKYDEAKVASTHWALEEFLREVWARTGAEEIHVVAHSMGNRAVTAALDRIMAGAKAKLPFHQIVFAAPDLDADHFQKLAEKIRGAGKRLTLYGSSKDKAILASKTAHTAPRAGDGGTRLVLAATVDSIDVSTLDTDFLSHSYIGDHSLLLTDLRALVTADTPPDKRQFLKQRKGGGWRFQPES